MRHCLPDPKAEEKVGEYFTVFSCEYDDGRRATGNSQILRIGEDGKIMMFLCESCLAQLREHFLYQLAMDALKKDQVIFRTMIERGIGIHQRRAQKEGDASTSSDVENNE